MQANTYKGGVPQLGSCDRKDVVKPDGIQSQCAQVLRCTSFYLLTGLVSTCRGTKNKSNIPELQNPYKTLADASD